MRKFCSVIVVFALMISLVACSTYPESNLKKKTLERELSIEFDDDNEYSESHDGSSFDIGSIDVNCELNPDDMVISVTSVHYDINTSILEDHDRMSDVVTDVLLTGGYNTTPAEYRAYRVFYYYMQISGAIEKSEGVDEGLTVGDYLEYISDEETITIGNWKIQLSSSGDTFTITATAS